jgi:hypothetical protein
MAVQSGVEPPAAMISRASGEGGGWPPPSSKGPAYPAAAKDPSSLTCLDIVEETWRRLALRGYAWDRPRP